MQRASVIGVALALLLAGFAAPKADAGDREDDRSRGRSRVETGRSGRSAPVNRHRGPVRPHLRWERGHYEYRTKQVWVPGYYRYEEIPAVYHEIHVRIGEVKLVLARPACTRKVWVPGYHEEKRVKVWVPGRYVRIVHPRPHARHGH
jgi:hypothetical protein